MCKRGRFRKYKEKNSRIQEKNEYRSETTGEAGYGRR